MELILLMVAMFAIMYFLMIRPQQKKMRKDQEMRAQLGEGDRVLLTSGIFGTIAHVGERQMIVELAPGVEITVLKGNVARKVTAEDEEFEFTDEIAEGEAPVGIGYDADLDAPLAHEASEASPYADDAVSPYADDAVNPYADDSARGPYDEPVAETETVEASNDDASDYQPWERKDAPSFEAPAEEKPRPEDSK
ncbi:preprotein translocase subunit YajC [Tessaracoccus aquimaris]|nr:preprotein translocase subunit YajC [Tessaracoccus aquimaris]